MSLLFPLFLNIPEILNGTISIFDGIIYSRYRLFIILMGLLIALGLYILITKTRLGIRIRAGQNDRQMISALGVDVFESKCFAIACKTVQGAASILSLLLFISIESLDTILSETVLSDRVFF